MKYKVTERDKKKDKNKNKRKKANRKQYEIRVTLQAGKQIKNHRYFHHHYKKKKLNKPNK